MKCGKADNARFWGIRLIKVRLIWILAVLFFVKSGGGEDFIAAIKMAQESDKNETENNENTIHELSAHGVVG